MRFFRLRIAVAVALFLFFVLFVGIISAGLLQKTNTPEAITVTIKNDTVVSTGINQENRSTQTSSSSTQTAETQTTSQVIIPHITRTRAS